MCETHYREMRLHQLRNEKAPESVKKEYPERVKIGLSLRNLLCGETVVLKGVKQTRVTSSADYYSKKFKRKFATHRIKEQDAVSVTRVK